MIRINLLREKKPKRADKGQQSLFAGFFLLLLAGAAVAFLVHMPLQGQVDQLNSDNAKTQKAIDALKASSQIQQFDVLSNQLRAVQDQEAAINRLNDARAVPAWMLREIGKILTKGQQPTMSDEMQERLPHDPNLKITQGWDSKRVWIDSIEEKGGQVTIVGGAQSDSDVTQFAKRLQLSVYFTDVDPTIGAVVEDPVSKVSYFKFTVTGKVLY